MNVGPADPHGCDAHLDFTGARLRSRLIRKTKLTIGDEFGNEHKAKVREAEDPPHIVKITGSMLNYRQFEAGPDPFGRKFQVYFKYLQTAISIRHSDTVDVKFVLEEDGAGSTTEKVIALHHAELLRLSQETGRRMDDPWCSRLAEKHLLHLISTGEDMEKNLVTVPYSDLQSYASELARDEQQAVAR